MFRITDQRHTNAIIAAAGRGVPIRLLVDPDEYRLPTRLWDAWNVDRMYAAGITTRVTVHQGLNHSKVVLLYGQGMTIFGSSNWTSPSANSQHEHNYFTKRSLLLDYFSDFFEWRWNNRCPTVAQAAGCTASQVANTTGGYFVKRKLTVPSAAARDDAAAKRLWEAREKLASSP